MVEDTCKYDRLQYELSVDEWVADAAALAMAQTKYAASEVRMAQKHQIYMACQNGVDNPGGPAVP